MPNQQIQERWACHACDFTTTEAHESWQHRYEPGHVTFLLPPETGCSCRGTMRREGAEHGPYLCSQPPENVVRDRDKPS